jgi:V-type H+-transporting ATPase subunit a
MGLLRSEAMSQGTLVLPVEGAHDLIDLIGKEMMVQFEDMNVREMRRPYRKYIQRIEEMERILRFLNSELPLFKDTELAKNRIEAFLKNDTKSPYELDKLEKELIGLNKRYLTWKEHNAKLLTEKNAAREELEITLRALKFSTTGHDVSRTEGLSLWLSGADAPVEAGLAEPLLASDSESKVTRIAGVINQGDEMRLRAAVFRCSFGKNLTEIYPIEEELQDPYTGLVVKKSAFVVFFQASGEKAPLYQKVMKICQALGANLYDWPKTQHEALTKQGKLTSECQEKEKLLSASMKIMQNEMEALVEAPQPGLNSKIEEWRMYCAKEKAIYAIMNLCTEGAGAAPLRVNVWYPKADEEKIKGRITKSTGGKGLIKSFTKDDGSTPPTYTRVNDFTEAWQDVINTYGIPRYQEANPGLFAVVTFPFIFGMMYGDIGHGSFLIMLGIFLCGNAKELKFKQPTLYYARFLILQLGIYATFAGFMYNDMFSLSLRLFPTRYADPDKDGVWTPTYDTKNEGGMGPYPFGLDYMWNGAENELLFVNSMKMKLSVIFGVLQMTLGVFIRWSNAAYQKSVLDFVCECVPMLVFMLCFFGWMDFMILYKWTHPDYPKAAPSIINSIIAMAMGQDDPNPLFDGSPVLAQILMLCVLCTVPVLLFPKPIIMAIQNSRKPKAPVAEEGNDTEAPLAGGGHGEHGEEFEFGEVFIHQVIETIEYVLGTVSHTASYLRIWALSLAHQQLALVFFSKTLQMGLEMSFPLNGIALYCMFTAWFGVTVAVLLGMDVMECFLHTLRLHWVEFQSKFYNVGGGGYQFAPFDIKKVVSHQNE